MTKVELSEFDSAKYLGSQEAIEAYLESALESGDPNHVINAIGNVIKAQGMTQIAKAGGLDRSNLHDSFVRAGGEPRFSTVLRVMNTLGFSFGLKGRSGNGAATA